MSSFGEVLKKAKTIKDCELFPNCWGKVVKAVEVEKLQTTLQEHSGKFPKAPQIKGILPKDWEDWFISLAIWKQELEEKLGCVEAEKKVKGHG